MHGRAKLVKGNDDDDDDIHIAKYQYVLYIPILLCRHMLQQIPLP
jgi:hypothetical protein